MSSCCRMSANSQFMNAELPAGMLRVACSAFTAATIALLFLAKNAPLASAQSLEVNSVPMAARNSVNLRTHLERIIKKAGHEPWPRLLQNLRARCETDWVEKYPSHMVAKWLGHSPKVAAQHYLMSREHHLEDVVRGTGANAASTKSRGRGGRNAWCRMLCTSGAKCVSARVRTRSH